MYCNVMYCTALHCTALYCTVLYCTVLYCTVLYCLRAGEPLWISCARCFCCLCCCVPVPKSVTDQQEFRSGAAIAGVTARGESRSLLK